MSQRLLSHYQTQYIAWLLTRRGVSDSVESIASTLVNSQVDLNPHQVEAALFACQNPLSRGVLLADEVGLGKTIEAGLVISQRWAERRRKILIIVPANLRKQWHQELQDKFNLQGTILEAKSFNQSLKQQKANPFITQSNPIICSYQFAKSKSREIQAIDWDLVVLDEAHRLRNVYKNSNVIAKSLKESLAHVHSKVLLTATPLQNSLLELYGLVSMIDERVFGDIGSGVDFERRIAGIYQNCRNPEEIKQSFEQLQQDLSAEINEAMVKEVRKVAATAVTLEEKLGYQKQQRELETKRSRLRKELFIRQDDIEAERNALIEQLEVQLQQQVLTQPLFTLEWKLV